MRCIGDKFRTAYGEPVYLESFAYRDQAVRPIYAGPLVIAIQLFRSTGLYIPTTHENRPIIARHPNYESMNRCSRSPVRRE